MSIRVRVPRIGGPGGVKFSTTRLMRTVGASLVGRIRERTTSGLDIQGRPFRSLSRAYAKRKREALGHGSADLQVSGRMLNGMRVTPRPAGLTISFTSGGGGGGGRTFIQRSRSVGAADKALFHNTLGAGKSRVKRPFFGLSDRDMDFILTAVEDHIAAEIRRGV